MLNQLRNLFRAFWPQFSWAVTDWLSNPRLMTLTLVIVTAVLIFATGARYRRRMVIASLGVLAAYLLIISPVFSIPATHLLVRFVPPDTGATADAIVVLARDTVVGGDRYHTAADMMASGRAPQVLVMGRLQGHNMFRRLEQRNLPLDTLLCSLCVRTTKDEAYAAGTILGARGVTQIILITDPPHMLRAWLTFKSLGFAVIPHMEPVPNDVNYYERSFLAIREYLGLISYAALGRFRSRPASALPQFAKEMSVNFPVDRCLMTAEQIRRSLVQS